MIRNYEYEGLATERFGPFGLLGELLIGASKVARRDADTSQQYLDVAVVWRLHCASTKEEKKPCRMRCSVDKNVIWSFGMGRAHFGTIISWETYEVNRNSTK